MVRRPAEILLPTTTVGALPRPSWYNYNLDGRDVMVAFRNSRHREAFLDASRVVIDDQNRAGLDIVSDGKMWYDEYTAGHSWPYYMLERINGLSGYERRPDAHLQKIAALRQIDEARGGYYPIVAGKISRGPLRFPEIFQMVSQLTQKPIKVGVIDPSLLARNMIDKFYKSPEELTLDICRLYNQELKALVAAGCKNIQLEDPTFLGNSIRNPPSKDMWNFAKEAWELTTSDLGDAIIWMHLCWGSPAGQMVWEKVPSYKTIFPEVLDFKNLDIINIESAFAAFSSAEGAVEDYKLFKEFPSKHLVAVGAVSHRIVQIESAEKVADLVRTAAKYIGPERLIVTTDCGLARQSLTRLHATLKLKSLVEGTSTVRNEFERTN